jgi:cation/acetate symporter
VTFYYMITTQVWLREMFFSTPRSVPVTNLWWDIQPISAGLFGVPLGFLIIVVVSLLTRAPDRETMELVETVRYPNLRAA